MDSNARGMLKNSRLQEVLENVYFIFMIVLIVISLILMVIALINGEEIPENPIWL